MNKVSKKRSGSGQSATYQIEVRGKLSDDWSDWFSGLTVALEDDITILTGPIADQAALRGILSKIWDLNLMLISLNRI